MKHLLSIILFLSVFHLASADLLTDITDGKYRAKTVSGIKSMNDGEHYTLLQNNKLIVKYSYKTGQAVDTIFDASTTKLNKIEQIRGYEFSPNEQKILVYNEQKFRYRRTFTSEYYVFDVKRNELKPLSEKGPQEVPLFSPDSRYIAFARENNLYLHKLDFGTESPITKDGEFGKVINGTPDWVYEEEFVNTRYFVFSPDSKLVAFVKFNETDVPTYQMQKYLQSSLMQDGMPLYPVFQSFKYPKPGQPNSGVSLCVYDDFYKSVRTVNLGTIETDFYIPRIKWTKEQDKLAVFVLNRNQNRLDMIYAHPKSLVSKLILREEDKYYVDYDIIDDIYFTGDGKYFTFVSERNGWRHAYLYNMNGTLSKALTQGNFDVTKVYGYDETKQTLYFQSAEQSPLQRDVYAVDAKGKKTRLTDGKGTHNALFSSTFAYFSDDASGLNSPNVTTMRNSKGESIRILEDNANLVAEFKSLNLPAKEFFSFTTSEGILLNGWMIKPVNFDSQKKYPALMTQYSGPNSQEVKDSWNAGWEYYLASQGYVVASVDGRGTAARGAQFRKCTYMQLGVLETKDQVEAAKYLGKQSFIDKNRIGIWGWSYGGFMTLNAMSTGEKIFKAGIAVAPVTDWRLYNSAYTERFMRQPKENNGGYDAGSPIKHAANLNGNVLIIHGTADDNVHVQNTYLYLDALLKADKQAELYLYTDKNHSILGKETRRHLYQKKFEFLESELKN
ncbi:MAG: S9 family peptidase [Bacteroidia bacterium]|nr:S9 family peptidase [Bacteroidia bacterium]